MGRPRHSKMVQVKLAGPLCSPRGNLPAGAVTMVPQSQLEDYLRSGATVVEEAKPKRKPARKPNTTDEPPDEPTEPEATRDEDVTTESA